MVFATLQILGGSGEGFSYFPLSPFMLIGTYSLLHPVCPLGSREASDLSIFMLSPIGSTFPIPHPCSLATHNEKFQI